MIELSEPHAPPSRSTTSPLLVLVATIETSGEPKQMSVWIVEELQAKGR